jgi:predicted aconitase with swiveling domain
MRLSGTELVGGRAAGELLCTDVGLSFWGGVDPLSGAVIDHTHPLHGGPSVAGKMLAVPNGRGSCTGSQVVLELLLNGMAPRALLLRQPDAILALGVIVAEELFGTSIPIVSLGWVLLFPDETHRKGRCAHQEAPCVVCHSLLRCIVPDAYLIKGRSRCLSYD